jgi:hypothetical protein
MVFGLLLLVAGITDIREAGAVVLGGTMIFITGVTVLAFGIARRRKP